MSRFLVYAVTSSALIVLGMYALVVYRHLVRKIIALNVIGSGVMLLLGAVAYRSGPALPDPIPHAMVLTGIVVSVSVTALAVALVRRIHALTGRVTLAEQEGLE
jgi:multicomponent Na+:H+ antiporter subunit C